MPSPTTLQDDTPADLLDRIGDVPLNRNLAHPAPGTATEADAVAQLDAAMRLMPGLIRVPDVSFVSWKQMPDGMPKVPVASLVPELVIEVFGAGNTKGEMNRKLRDYFLSGVQVVWIIYPRTETAERYTAPDSKTRVRKGGTLEAGEAVPGFRLPLKNLFDVANQKPPRP
jgi:Uma2 family endonuclease